MCTCILQTMRLINIAMTLCVMMKQAAKGKIIPNSPQQSSTVLNGPNSPQQTPTVLNGPNSPQQFPTVMIDKYGYK